MIERPALILVPGLLCTAVLFADQLPTLDDLAAPQVTAEHARHEHVADIAAAILAAAPPRFALAGLSLGGYVALELVRQAPGRVDRLALLDTASRADTPEQRQRRLDLMALAGSGKFKGVTPRLLPILIHPDRLSDAPLVACITAMADAIGKEGFLRQQRAIMSRSDLRPMLPSIACPTLVLCGRQDQLTPLDRSQEMAEAIPGARLVILDSCGHLSTMERPDEVAAALRDWLAE